MDKTFKQLSKGLLQMEEMGTLAPGFDWMNALCGTNDPVLPQLEDLEHLRFFVLPAIRDSVNSPFEELSHLW